MDTYGDQKYYVKKINPQSNWLPGNLTIDNDYSIFHLALMRLANREITGNKAVEWIEHTILSFVYEDQEILKNIVDRNLKVGFSIDNFNSVCKISDKFSVALAENLTNVKNVDPIDGSFFASRKCDGARCVAFIHNFEDENGQLTQIVFFKSRQNKTFTTLSNLVPGIKSLTKDLRGHWVLDGECCIVDENGDEHFPWIMQEITRKDHTIKNPCYKVFDILTLDEFEERKESPIFSDRLKLLNKLFSSNSHPNIDLLKQERILTQDDFDRWTKYVETNNWEGFMLRKDVVFKAGRSNDLIKVKKFQDNEYVVINTINGQATYNDGGHKIYDVCSALVIEHKGNKVEVGSGLSKEQRLQWFARPQDIIGKTITVQYFEETKNKKNDSISLRFPVLKYVYENGREV